MKDAYSDTARERHLDEFTVMVHVRERYDLDPIGGVANVAKLVYNLLGKDALLDVISSVAVKAVHDEKDGDFWDWLRTGIERGYCDEPVCDTHDGMSLSDWEIDLFDEGHDICVNVVRVRGPLDNDRADVEAAYGKGSEDQS